jgi:hypothetical protein
VRNLLEMAGIEDDDLGRIGDIDKEHLLLRIKHRPARPSRHWYAGDHRVCGHVHDRHRIRIRDLRVPDVSDHEAITPRIIRQAVRTKAGGDFHQVRFGVWGKDAHGVFTTVGREYEMALLGHEGAGHAR